KMSLQEVIDISQKMINDTAENLGNATNILSIAIKALEDIEKHCDNPSGVAEKALTQMFFEVLK
ncbi:MAG TPA: hypothetical protein VMX17_07370, partial [Candidatus Glassbacteria bacterium]|nr:hypothetical protein [Candidatus Glassbacteria bacterium]